MPRLPQVSGKECIEALKQAGFYEVRRESSHIYVRRENPFVQISVPDHKTLKKGTLRKIIRQAGLTVDDFIDLL
jgi:predicted RNA binding protein YcfA (HicA-like mRNA interferase family)